ISVASSAGATTPAYGIPVTFTATVANLDSSAIAAGVVEFFDGATDLGQGQAGGVVNGSPTWTFTTSTLAAGPHAIAAAFTPAAKGLIFDFQASDDKANRLSQPVAMASTTITGSTSGLIFG